MTSTTQHRVTKFTEDMIKIKGLTGEKKIEVKEDGSIRVVGNSYSEILYRTFISSASRHSSVKRLKELYGEGANLMNELYSNVDLVRPMITGMTRLTHTENDAHMLVRDLFDRMLLHTKNSLPGLDAQSKMYPDMAEFQTLIDETKQLVAKMERFRDELAKDYARMIILGKMTVTHSDDTVPSSASSSTPAVPTPPTSSSAHAALSSTPPTASAVSSVAPVAPSASGSTPPVVSTSSSNRSESSAFGNFPTLSESIPIPRAPRRPY